MREGRAVEWDLGPEVGIGGLENSAREHWVRKPGRGKALGGGARKRRCRPGQLPGALGGNANGNGGR
ncbi:unnamed protein product [Coccothraustes coccothraustes]